MAQLSTTAPPRDPPPDPLGSEQGSHVRAHRAAVFGLLLAALLFRLWAVPLARFTGDESDYWARSRRLALAQELPIYGPEITGSAAHLPGPAYYFLMAAPQRLGGSPYFGSVFVVLGHVLAAWLLYDLARRARGPRAGLLALALVAFAPWDVLYADRIWGSCVVPVWGALALWAAVKSRDGPRWQGVVLFLAAVLPQLHLSVPVLWLALAVIFVFYRPPRLHWKSLGLGALATLVAYALPLHAELKSGFANTQAILAHSGGAETSATLWQVPLKVFGYGVLYASSEIGYHFARGYWGGGFDEGAAYFTAAGWSRWLEHHGPLWGALGIVSLALAFSTWGASLGRTARRAAQALRTRSAAALDLDCVLTLAILTGFGVGAALMMLAKKTYFPHYANILMPIALWPAVSSLDRAFGHRRLRLLAGGALGLAAVAMFSSAARYYTRVDGLNGLRPTLQMVERALAEESPVRVDFTHFQNHYAWRVVASVLHGRELPLHAGAPVRLRVHNSAPHEGELPAGSERFGPVRLERQPPEGARGVRGSPLREAWREWAVLVLSPDGRTRRCALDEAVKACRYGDQPWQRFGPELMEVGGRLEPLLFLHPIQDRVLRAEPPRPAAATRGVLTYALTDGATRSNNTAPVILRVLEGDREIAVGEAKNVPGLQRLPFSLETAGAPLAIEVTTSHEGARILGIDLALE